MVEREQENGKESEKMVEREQKNGKKRAREW